MTYSSAHARPPSPDGADTTKVRPLQGRNDLAASLSVGFTYGYSRCAASRRARTPSENPLTKRLVGGNFKAKKRRI